MEIDRHIEFEELNEDHGNKNELLSANYANGISIEYIFVFSSVL